MYTYLEIQSRSHVQHRTGNILIDRQIYRNIGINVEREKERNTDSIFSLVQEWFQLTGYQEIREILLPFVCLLFHLHDCISLYLADMLNI
jgi:hypothetical protein